MKIPFKGYPITKFIPNMTTLLGLCVGLTAVYHAFNHSWERALWFIVIATVFDGMDGRLARFFNASSKFGAELDSLSDFVTFGVSPALIVYFYSLNELGRFGWGVVLFFCVCSGLRLARFNTMLELTEIESLGIEQSKVISNKKYFTGVPMPAAGLLMLLPLMIELDADFEFKIPNLLYACWGGIIGLLMVSKIPTFALKGMKIQHHQILPLVGGMALFVIGMIMRPWLVLPLIGGIYMVSFIISYRTYTK